MNTQDVLRAVKDELIIERVTAKIAGNKSKELFYKKMFEWFNSSNNQKKIMTRLLPAIELEAWCDEEDKAYREKLRKEVEYWGGIDNGRGNSF